MGLETATFMSEHSFGSNRSVFWLDNWLFWPSGHRHEGVRDTSAGLGRHYHSVSHPQCKKRGERVNLNLLRTRRQHRGTVLGCLM